MVVDDISVRFLGIHAFGVCADGFKPRRYITPYLYHLEIGKRAQEIGFAQIVTHGGVCGVAVLTNAIDDSVAALNDRIEITPTIAAVLVGDSGVVRGQGVGYGSRTVVRTGGPCRPLAVGIQTDVTAPQTVDISFVFG